MNRMKLAVVMLAFVLLPACAMTPKIDLVEYVLDPLEKVEIPKVCKLKYENAIPRVAIAEISNNTTFDYAKMVEAQVSRTSSKQSAGGAVVWGASEQKKFKAESSVIARNVNAKLSESVGDGIIDELTNLGGFKLYARSDMEKIIKEQKLQHSGLFDEKQLGKLGKLAGVKYMITGSINNVNLSYVSHQRIKDIIPIILGPVIELNEGWHVETEVNVRMLDVESGEIVLSNNVKGKEIMGIMPYPKYDMLIGAIKKAAAKGLRDIRPEFSKYFTIKGSVMQTGTRRDGTDKIALVNIGENQKITAGTTLYAYVFKEVQDPMTGETVCDQQKLPVELSVSNQIQSDKSWCLIKCDPRYRKDIKPWQLVERAPVKGQGIPEILGY
ncbi:MAG: CsgG/HfaB family protein [Pedobacter sp.]